MNMDTPESGMSSRSSFEGDVERMELKGRSYAPSLLAHALENNLKDRSYQSSPGSSADENDTPTQKEALVLTPVDGGRAAWSFLAAGSVLEVLVFGLPSAIGILHEYWSTELFPNGRGSGTLTLTSTLQGGLLYLSGIMFTPLFHRYPHHRVLLQAIGLVGASLALLGSAFATEPFHLLITMGCIYPLSGLLYLPAATLLFEHFVFKRGLASGIMFSGVGVGGTLFPFIMQSLLHRFGYRDSMISIAIGYLLIGGIALSQIKPRIPLPKRHINANRKLDKSFLYRSPFWAFTFAILLTSLGNFIPSVWIASFAADLSLSREDGTILVALMSASSIPGLLFFGWLSDRAPLRVVLSISCVGSALTTLLFWGFSANFRLLSIFVIFFGFLGLSFTSIWSKLITIVARDDPALPPVILSLFAASRGLGNTLSGPISTALLSANFTSKIYGVNNYGALILYTGFIMLAGWVVGLCYRDSPKARSH